MSNTNTINARDLVKILSEVKGASIVTLVAKTIPEMNKSIPGDNGRIPNPYYGKLHKLQRVNGMINWIYENSVNRQRVREGKEPDFESAPRQWGVRVARRPFVIYSNRLYLELKVQRYLEVWYQCGNKMLSEEEVLPYIRQHYGSTRQGLENEVILRDFRLDHIEEISVMGEHYKVEKVGLENLVKLLGVKNGG